MQKRDKEHEVSEERKHTWDMRGLVKKNKRE